MLPGHSKLSWIKMENHNRMRRILKNWLNVLKSFGVNERVLHIEVALFTNPHNG